MRRVIFNQKGGVGKTSITCNLAAAFAKLGRKVLVIDLDAQANSSQYLLGDSYAQDLQGVHHFFESTLSFRMFKDSLGEGIQESIFENLSIIPACSALGDIQSKLEHKYKIMKLSAALDVVASTHGYDEILIDTPPALNFYSMSALIASDKVLIPFDCDAFSAQGIFQVVETVEEIRDDYRPGLEVEGVIVNSFQIQAKLPKSTIDLVKKSNLPILEPYLSSSIVMKESHSRKSPLVFCKPSHKLSKEYTLLAKNLIGSEKTVFPIVKTSASSIETNSSL